ncbi:MAG: hypothetical protein HUJ97_08100 [Bacteroidales bacterium]|nr:hypothetical protein [Bacteroidales bacterium]
MSMGAQKAVVISSNGSDIIIRGTEQGERISLYSLEGNELNSTIASDEETFIPCNVGRGNFVIVKYGEKAVKVKL